MRCFAITITLFFVACAAIAQVPDLAHSSAQWETNPILLVPDGSGDLLSDVGNEVHVWLRDSSGNPVVGVPADQIYLEYFYIYPPLPFCYNNGSEIIARATADTDSQGHAVIDGPLFGNDANGNNFDWVAVTIVAPNVGWQLDWTYELTAVSPDINGDFEVNLSDLSPFVTLYQAGDLRVDFDHSGSVTISDIAILSASMGAQCP